MLLYSNTNSFGFTIEYNRSTEKKRIDFLSVKDWEESMAQKLRFQTTSMTGSFKFKWLNRSRCTPNGSVSSSKWMYGNTNTLTLLRKQEQMEILTKTLKNYALQKRRCEENANTPLKALFRYLPPKMLKQHSKWNISNVNWWIEFIDISWCDCGVFHRRGK